MKLCKRCSENFDDGMRFCPKCGAELINDPDTTFKIENGNIVWGEDWDLIFPIEQLHQGRIE